SVVNVLTKTLRCYRRELVEVAVNPTSRVLLDRLDRWFQAEERDQSDWVVLYYTGHAKVIDNKLYLLTKDFEPYRYASTAFNLSELSTMVAAERAFGRHRRVGNLWIIVDTCFAGAGTQELPSRFGEIGARTGGGHFYFWGTALPLEEADAGKFTEALVEVIDDYSRRNVRQEYLDFGPISVAINERLNQRTVLSTLTTADYPQYFLPNPSYIDTNGKAVPADQAQRAISNAEFRDHWGPRSRGVEFDSQPGAYFFGRETVLAKLAVFLDSSSDNRTR